MDRENLLKLWDESWTEGIWFGSWSKALEGVSAEQAAWQPKPGLHSIWQLVHHVTFWHEYGLDRLAGGPQLSDAEIERRNFPAPEAVTEAAWKASRTKLEKSHRAMRDAMADEKHTVERLMYHLGHDANHLGQILYVRRMMGLGVVEG